MNKKFLTIILTASALAMVLLLVIFIPKPSQTTL